jgi:hypothetical protein
MDHFISNKYTKWYFSIINNRRAQLFKGYGECHHIIPASLGGSNAPFNIVRLTAREHFICHLLLTKMVSGNNLYKMKTAFIAMSNLRSKWHQNNRINSKLFEKIKHGLIFTDEQRKKISESVKKSMTVERRKQISAKAKERVASSATKHKMSESSKNRKLTPELRNKFRTAKKTWTGRSHSKESKERISKSCLGRQSAFKGKVHSEETKNLISEKKRGKTPKTVTVTCPHCRKSGASTIMNRYHFNKCKMLTTRSSPSLDEQFSLVCTYG